MSNVRRVAARLDDIPRTDITDETAGRSQVQISTALGIDRKTIRKYLAPTLAAGLAPGEGGKFDEALWLELISGWFPEVGDPADDARRKWIWRNLREDPGRIVTAG